MTFQIQQQRCDPRRAELTSCASVNQRRLLCGRHCQENRKTGLRLRENICKHTSHKGPLSKIHRVPKTQPQESKQPDLKWAKDFNRRLTREDRQVTNEQVKTRSTSCHQGNAKQTAGTHCTLSAWPKSGTLTTPHAGEDVRWRELSSGLGQCKRRGHAGRQVGGFLQN